MAIKSFRGTHGGRSLIFVGDPATCGITEDEAREYRDALTAAINAPDGMTPPTEAEIDASKRTLGAEEALESAARQFASNSGPGSAPRQRDLFKRDLQTAALRYSRAYAAQARVLDLIPEVK